MGAIAPDCCGSACAAGCGVVRGAPVSGGAVRASLVGVVRGYASLRGVRASLAGTVLGNMP